MRQTRSVLADLVYPMPCIVMLLFGYFRQSIPGEVMLPQFKYTYIVALFFLLVLQTSCQKKLSVGGYGVGDVSGAWVKPISGRTGIEGFFLHPDGKVRLINIFSMQGDTWSLKEDRLTLFTHTERYPQPVADVYSIQTLSDQKMVLARQDGVIEYRRPAPGTQLLETRWGASYVPGPSADAEPEREVFFSLRNDGRIAGFAGCNTFSGSFTMLKETIKIGPLLSTKMFCPAMLVEDNLLRALGQAEDFLVVEDQLYLYKNNVLQGFFKAKQNQ